jgi:hemoglobin-like flavoprotein
VDRSLETIAKTDFTIDFYHRLFAKHQTLVGLFSDPAHQPHILATTLADLLLYEPDIRHSRMRATLDRHTQYKIQVEDVDAFRCVFLEQIKSMPGTTHATLDAWNAVLQHGLGYLKNMLLGMKR